MRKSFIINRLLSNDLAFNILLVLNVFKMKKLIINNQRKFHNNFLIFLFTKGFTTFLGFISWIGFLVTPVLSL